MQSLAPAGDGRAGDLRREFISTTLKNFTARRRPRTIRTSVRTEHHVVAAATLHFELLTVRLLQDGNDRTARFVQNLHHLATGYAPVLIDPTEKANYLSVVQKAQVAVPASGDHTDFVADIVGLDFRALDRYLRSLEIAYGPEFDQSESSQSLEEQRQESQTRRRR